FAPAWAKAVAIPSPMPDAAPVTNTVFPASSFTRILPCASGHPRPKTPSVPGRHMTAFSRDWEACRMSVRVKVCGCRPHDGGAAHTGVGVRKPPREETAGCRARWRVRRYGDFVVWGSLAGCVDHLCRERSKRWRTRQVDSDSRNWRRAAKIDRRVGYPGRRDGEHGHGRSRRGEAEAQWNVAAKRFWS